MNIIERIKGILVNPKEEWKKINLESTSSNTLVTNYLLPLAVLSALATFLGIALLGHGIMKIGIYVALIQLVSLVLGVYGAAFVTDALAPSFDSEKNLQKSMQLVVYSSTPALLGGLLSIVPDLGWLGLLVGAVYSIYLLFLGIPILKKTPEDKVPIYLIIVILVMGVIYWLVQYILQRIFARMMFGGLGRFYM